jgi:hypothetical protein
MSFLRSRQRGRPKFARKKSERSGKVDRANFPVYSPLWPPNPRLPGVFC